MSPTKRTLDAAREMGMTVQVVERFCHFSKRRIDLLGCIDLVAVKPGIGIIGIQACAGSSHAARRTKALAEPRLREWLESGGRFEVWSWAKQGPRGKVKRWTLRREEIKLDQLAA
jgi:hypothetical protein